MKHGARYLFYATGVISANSKGILLNYQEKKPEYCPPLAGYFKLSIPMPYLVFFFPSMRIQPIQNDKHRDQNRLWATNLIVERNHVVINPQGWTSDPIELQPHNMGIQATGTQKRVEFTLRVNLRRLMYQLKPLYKRSWLERLTYQIPVWL